MWYIYTFLRCRSFNDLSHHIFVNGIISGITRHHTGHLNISQPSIFRMPARRTSRESNLLARARKFKFGFVRFGKDVCTWVQALELDLHWCCTCCIDMHWCNRWKMSSTTGQETNVLEGFQVDLAPQKYQAPIPQWKYVACHGALATERTVTNCPGEQVVQAATGSLQ